MSSLVTIAVNKFDLNCPICTDILIEPLTLICGHSYCYECLKSYCKNKYVEKCPTCNNKINVHFSKFSTNTFIKNMLNTIPDYAEKSRDYEERKKYVKLLETFEKSKLNQYLIQLITKTIKEHQYIHFDNLIQNVKSLIKVTFENIDVGIKYYLKKMLTDGTIIIFNDIVMQNLYYPIIDNYIRKNINVLTSVEVYYMGMALREKNLHKCNSKDELELFDLHHDSVKQFLVDNSSKFNSNYPTKKIEILSHDLDELDNNRLLIPIVINSQENILVRRDNILVMRENSLVERVFENPPLPTIAARQAIDNDSSYSSGEEVLPGDVVYEEAEEE